MGTTQATNTSTTTGNTASTTNPTQPTKVSVSGVVMEKCATCGKYHNPQQGTTGTRCNMLATGKLTANKITVASVPENWLKMPAVGRAYKLAGVAISKLVTAFGNDKGTGKLLHTAFMPVYCMGTRYMHPWVITKSAIAMVNTGKGNVPATVTSAVIAVVATGTGTTPNGYNPNPNPNPTNK